MSLFLGCSNGRRPAEKPSQSKQISKIKAKLPDSLQNLENLQVYSLQDQPYDTVTFQREQVFESSKEAIFDGYTGEIAVDEQNRVYIAVTKLGSVAVYVFSPEGEFITKFLREGRGPGEFIKISDILLQNNSLYVFGGSLQKVGIFNLKSHNRKHSITINTDSLTDKLSVLKADDLLSTNEGRLIVSFKGSTLFNPNMLSNKYYYEISKKGIVIDKPILKIPKTSFYKPNNRKTTHGTIRLPRSMPFSRNTLVSAGDSLLYSAWTEHFLIKVYDKSGNYRRAFYYPYEQAPLSVSEMPLGEARQKLIEEHPEKVPDTWPVIHNITADDEGRLWGQTITKSDSTYKGWVLNNQGKLLARFSWPGRRAERTPETPPLFKIKNGYLYTRERDISKGIDRIVKHKINFE
ncbi:BF3164 family lipoprotein [Fodinibius halophilus]|uniref:BF3164 family lipoprotein n=1 Tax=Fodinibius halophilus TaxID=1736908 RepID=UPI00197AF974|nr:BF3164 family lipoprotein [Fodinibius halophilus]